MMFLCDDSDGDGIMTMMLMCNDSDDGDFIKFSIIKSWKEVSHAE